MFKNGVFDRFILISFPRPDAAFSETERIKLPYSFFPRKYLVLLSAPLTFFTFKVSSSVSVKLKTIIDSANSVC